ncbi:MAG: sulfatase [Bacteroidota bacterium]|nr:sulfatase [Bacteroidota bacterium]
MSNLLKRRIIILVFTIAVSLPAASISIKPSIFEEKSIQPNIVLLLIENISTELSCYGEPDIKTPNIDRLAEEGVRYTQAFTTSSVCAPSRAAMMTGTYQIKSNTQHLRMNRNRNLPLPYRAFTHYLREGGYYTALGCGYSAKTDINFSPREGNIDGFDGDDWSKRAENQPFFAQITLDITHRGKHWYTDDPQIDPASITLAPETPDHKICRDDFARYLSQIQKMDIQVSEILHRLDKEGLSNNTLVIFMGDNGADLFRGMDWLYDAGIHVPLIIRWPGQLEQGMVNNHLISSLDVIATILQIAGINIPDHFDGFPIFGSDVIHRDYIYAARDRVDEAIDRIRCVRSKQFKYIRNYMPERGYYEKRWAVENNPTLDVGKELHLKGKLTPEQELHMADTKPEEELYDLKNDPHEFQNLVENSNFQTTLETMRKLMDEWIDDTGDCGQFQEKREDALETEWFIYDEVYGKNTLIKE